MLQIRKAVPGDEDDLWAILEGDTYDFPPATTGRSNCGKGLGFQIVGRVPEIFLHPVAGDPGALVMYQRP